MDEPLPVELQGVPPADAQRSTTKKGNRADRSTDKKGAAIEHSTEHRDQSWWDGLDARMAARGITPPPDYHPDDDAPPEPRDRAIIDRLWFPDSPTLAAVAEGPLLTRSWGDGEAADVVGLKSPHQTRTPPREVVRNRHKADLVVHPGCESLNKLAVRSRSGAEGGTGSGENALGQAYASSASAELVVEAERAIAFIGQPGDTGYTHRATRMAHWVRKLNRQLLRYNGLHRTLATITIYWRPGSPTRRVDAMRLSLSAAQAVAEQATHATAGADASPGSGADPPPLDSACVAPLLRTGPPSSRVRVAA